MYLSTMYCMNVIWVFLPEINFTYLLTNKWLHGVGGSMDVPPPAQYQICYLFFTALMDQNIYAWKCISDS